MTAEKREELRRKLQQGGLSGDDTIMLPFALVLELVEDTCSLQAELEVTQDELREAQEELATWRRTYQ